MVPVCGQLLLPPCFGGHIDSLLFLCLPLLLSPVTHPSLTTLISSTSQPTSLSLSALDLPLCSNRHSTGKVWSFCIPRRTLTTRIHPQGRDAAASFQPPVDSVVNNNRCAMWWWTYLFLALVRLLFALSPSYLHPDENFQGPEVIAGRNMLRTCSKSTMFLLQRVA